MRFVHISDLHIGKKLKEASLEEDQRHILSQIVDVVRDYGPDGVIIAGDVYDTPSPSTDSVMMLDRFLTELTSMDLSVFMISGNHDSPERLGFGSRMFERNNLFISGTYSGHMDVHTLRRDGEEVDVCMLPFIKPVHARRAHPEDAIENYTDAVRSAISHTEFTEGRKRVAVTHQFVVNGGECPETSDSESIFVGGTESVDVSVFDGFDYVALGHLHRPQSVGRQTVRYCGTPLKYSLSEAEDVKSVTLVEIGDTVSVSTVPLEPLRDVRKIHGPLDGILSAGRDDPSKDDFVYVVLETDEIDALSRLREVYPNVMSLDVVPRQGQAEAEESLEGDPWGMDIAQVFESFFKDKNGKELTEGQRSIVRDLLDEGAVL